MPRRPTKAEQQQIIRHETELNRRLPPGSRHHQYWCAIFRGKRCDCDDRPPRARVQPRLDGGGAVNKARAKRELETA